MLDKANWITKSSFNNGSIAIYETYDTYEHRATCVILKGMPKNGTKTF